MKRGQSAKTRVLHFNSFSSPAAATLSLSLKTHTHRASPITAMPRTTVVECPGCPPIRALTFDVLGLVKVIEARGKQSSAPKVVERWGDPDASRCVLAVSINDRKLDPLLAVARKNGSIEVVSPVNGYLRASVKHVADAGISPKDDAVVGLHLFKKQKLDSSSRSCTLLTCTTKGNASIRSVEVAKSEQDSVSTNSPNIWKVSAAGNILCSKVDGNEDYALFGGKGVEMNVWDLDKCVKIWNSKSPPKNSLGIFDPTWFTSATFLTKDDHRKVVAGTNSHQVRLYDISAQRRPVMSFDFRETPIKAVTEDLDGTTIYVGNGTGDMASFDIRTGKLLGCFLGKCSGSIRSIARHPELPVLASCGLDSYVRFWDVKSRQLLSAVFLKQHLSSVVFDSNFSDEEVAVAKKDVPSSKAQDADDTSDEDDEDPKPVKRKKSSKEDKKSKKSKSNTKTESEGGADDTTDEDVEEPKPVKRKKSSKEHKTSKESKSKKGKKLESEDEDVGEPKPVKRKKSSKEEKESKSKRKSKEAESDEDEE